ncbi:MAG: bifunctional aldolase/short-chain dehydrogenase [Anaerolineae bacterium]|nr:bifunctional aldolase/short-chain dehydrogenase [Anaerolineae bacterium]
MQSQWNAAEAAQLNDDPLQLRVYTSRLLGREPSLVLHGGGNTSVKAQATNLFGERVEVLYVKGSGWDLATIEAAGFPAVKMDVLLRLAEMETLSDTVIVREQRAAMLDPNGPNPSVEAILHAIIPFRFVDHTHADVVVALTNTPNGEALMRQIYGERVLLVPYIMPGFPLARKVYEMTRQVDWQALEGIILLNHGVFTFADDARTAYENMLKLVTQAEAYLASVGGAAQPAQALQTAQPDPVALSQLRQQVSHAAGRPLIVRLDASPSALGFANRPDAAEIGTRGCLTPDHVIRTKRTPIVLGGQLEEAVQHYVQAYIAYFEAHQDGNLTMLDPAPRWGIWPGQGTVAFGETVTATQIVADITEHTVAALQWAEALGGWQALPPRDLFQMEYWELEQAKLKKKGSQPPFQGKIALVTGAASGIGKATVEALVAQGAAVVGLDINPTIESLMPNPDFLGIPCDLTDAEALQSAVAATVRTFGGLDMLVLNAGIFPESMSIETLQDETWERVLALNLTSQQRLLQACLPYLKHGLEAAIVGVASRNVPAPGPGVSAYSVSKAGLTQLLRVAALELAPLGIRVNILHPDAVFDTALWTDDLLQKRAQQYGISVEAYKRRNLLSVEIRSKDVADMICVMLGPVFSKTTGAQVPLDGGNNRVI